MFLNELYIGKTVRRLGGRIIRILGTCNTYGMNASRLNNLFALFSFLFYYCY